MFSKICFPLLGQNCYFDNDLQFEVISIVLVTNDFEHVIIRRKLKPYKEVNIIPIYNEQKLVAQSQIEIFMHLILIFHANISKNLISIIL